MPKRKNPSGRASRSRYPPRSKPRSKPKSSKPKSPRSSKKQPKTRSKSRSKSRSRTPSPSRFIGRYQFPAPYTEFKLKSKPPKVPRTPGGKLFYAWWMANRALNLAKKHEEKYDQASGYFGTHHHSKLPGSEPPKFTYD